MAIGNQLGSSSPTQNMKKNRFEPTTQKKCIKFLQSLISENKTYKGNWKTHNKGPPPSLTNFANIAGPTGARLGGKTFRMCFL